MDKDFVGWLVALIFGACIGTVGMWIVNDVRRPSLYEMREIVDEHDRKYLCEHGSYEQRGVWVADIKGDFYCVKELK